MLRLPTSAWTFVYDADRQIRPDTWVAELSGLLRHRRQAGPARRPERHHRRQARAEDRIRYAKETGREGDAAD
jgi:hypothetical protein